VQRRRRRRSRTIRSGSRNAEGGAREE